MSGNKLTGVVLLGMVVLMAGGLYLAYRSSTPDTIKSTEEAKAVTQVVNKELGVVGINQGLQVTDFIIENGGSEELLLYDVTTSCMCTVAQVESGGVISPEFVMGKRSSHVMKVLPGSSATVKMIFDPAYHGPGGIGEVTRQVMMRTNDANQSMLVFTMSATVVQ
jgi:hypothetical protein